MKHHKKQNLRAKTFKNKKGAETLSVIKNKELEKHRRLFLGKPGSNQWNAYYDGLIKTKRLLFNIVRTPELRSSVGVRGLSGDGLPSKDNGLVVRPRSTDCELLKAYK